MRTKALFLAVAAISTTNALAQSYTVIELAGGGAAATAGGLTVGQTGQYEGGRATLWDTSGAATNVHPAFLATAAGPGFSNVLGTTGSLSVGLGQRNDTPNQASALKWVGTTATALANPFTIYSSVALATDGAQIVGWASALQIVRGQPSPAPMHAILWDAASGRVLADLSGGRTTAALSVANGQQVGYEVKGGPTEARLWRGTAASVVNLHPKAYGTSAAYATDGVHQVGTVTTTVRLQDERRKGRDVTMNAAAVWSGSATGVTTLPLSLNGYAYTTAVALGVKGKWVCGYGMGLDRFGAYQTHHAAVWDLTTKTVFDLHSLLPAGYRESHANGVDASGNVAGYAIDAAGASHAILWRLNAA